MPFESYLLIILRNDRLYHPELLKRPVLEKLGGEYAFRGNRYSLIPEYAFRMSGDSPTDIPKVWQPWSIMYQISDRWIRKTGLLLFREPEKVTDVPIKPENSIPRWDETEKRFGRGSIYYTTKMIKALVLSPLLARARRKRLVQSNQPVLLWLMLGIIVIIFILIFTGVLKIQGG